MKADLRDRIEKTLLRYNIYLWNPGISDSANSYVGGTYFVHPQVILDLIRASRREKK